MRCSICKRPRLKWRGVFWCPHCDGATGTDLAARVYGKAGVKLYQERLRASEAEKKKGPE